MSFTLPAVDVSLLRLSTVDDVFVRVGDIDEVGTTKEVPPALARRVARLPFAAGLTELRRVRPMPERPRFDVVASLEGRRTYNRFAVERAVGAALAPVLRGSYLERTGAGLEGGDSELTVRIFIRGPDAVAALRLHERPLHRRDYKLDTGPATLHPPLAAAMARLLPAEQVGARRQAVLLDPFCGDATIVIEAARSRPDAMVVGSDIDWQRLANARRNASRAGATAALVRADVADPPWRAGSVDAVVTNPPWSVGVSVLGRLSGRIDPLWAWLGEVLTPRGRVCVVTDQGVDAPQALRRAGYSIALDTQLRLAGRISHLLVGAPPGRPPATLPPGLATWRDRTIAAGVLTDTGF